jgi:RND family efflux transporter MFP subunit
MRVAPGDVLAQLGTDTRRARLDEASATLQRVIAERLQAEHRAERIAQLVEDGSVSEQDYDDAKLTAQAFNAAEDSARALQRSAELSLNKSTLLAPYDAVVAERLVQIGAVVAPGTPVLRLVTAAGREAHIGVPIEIARRLKVGDSYPLTLTGITVDATLRAIRDHLDPATLTVGAVFDFSDQTHASVGESAELTIEESVEAVGSWLPITALLAAPRGLWDVLAIYADDEGHFRARRESVEILYTRGDQAFVTGTVIPGEAVVAAGLQRISPGDLVEPLFIANKTSTDKTAL